MDKPRIFLLKYDKDGQLKKENFMARPSFPCPVVKTSVFKPEKMVMTSDYQLTCDVRVKGTVSSSFCDVIPGEKGQIGNIIFKVNGEDKGRLFPVEVEKTQDINTAKPFPFPFVGYFEGVIENVEVTEGLNTFEIIAYDPSTNMHGSSFWTVSFTADYIESENGDYKPGPKGLTAEEPNLVYQGVDPEINLYGFGVEGLRGDEEDVKLVVGNESPIILDLKRIGDTGSFVAVRPTTLEMLQFCMLPAKLGEGRKPYDENLNKSLGEAFKLPGEDTRGFSIGFTTGFFFGGCRLEAGDISCDQVLDFEDSGLIPKINVHLSKDSDPVIDVDVPLIYKKVLEVSPEYFDTKNSTGNFYAILDSRARESRESKFDVLLGLLSGDSEELGIPWEFYDWRKSMYSVLSEVTVEFITDEELSLPVQRGYFVGRCFSEATRGSIDPRGIDHREGRGEFLLRLPVLSHLFRNKSRGAKILEGMQDLIGGLTGMQVNTNIPPNRGF